MNNIFQHTIGNIQHIFNLTVKKKTYIRIIRKAVVKITSQLESKKMEVNKNVHMNSKYNLKGRHIKLGNTFIIFILTNLKGKKLITTNSSLKAPYRSESVFLDLYYIFSLCICIIFLLLCNK